MSITKNPIILQSAVYVYNWFLTKTKDSRQSKIINMIEVADSDLYVANKVKQDYENRVKYENIEERLRKVNNVYSNNKK